MNAPFVTDADGKIYITPTHYELTYGRAQRTIRSWIRLKLVRSIVDGSALYVHLDDCRRLDQATPVQQRSLPQRPG